MTENRGNWSHKDFPLKKYTVLAERFWGGTDFTVIEYELGDSQPTVKQRLIMSEVQVRPFLENLLKNGWEKR